MRRFAFFALPVVLRALTMILLVALILVLGTFGALAHTVTLSTAEAQFVLHTTELEDGHWLFLPSFAKLSALSFPEDGLQWRIAEAEEENVFRAEGWRDDTLNAQFHIMQSENLKTMFLFSSDPVNEGRSYIENCERHEHETSGFMAFVDTNASLVYMGDLRQIRGRGNGSWAAEGKKPYQIKLETPFDLLHTGERDESNRTWVLLVDSQDMRALRSRIAMDLSLELGIADASHSEPVELYYDGEYLGLYLLAEKVEIGSGRIDETDYDKILEAWNSGGQQKLESLSVAEGENRFGNCFTYIQDVQDNQMVDAGAYLVELENVSTLSDRCYFYLGDQVLYSLKNPENASRQMVQYVSERLEEARQTLLNGGVNPENGRTIHDDFDVDAFARILLINEWAYNVDGFKASSSFFVLPAGETRFRPGPAWDFDRSMRYAAYTDDAGALLGLDNRKWQTLFLGCEAFVEAVQRVYEQELYPLITEVLLGDRPGRYLRSLDDYAAQVRTAACMDARRWPGLGGHPSLRYGRDVDEEILLLRRFLTERNEWLYTTLTEHGGVSADCINITFSARYMKADSQVDLFVFPWSQVEVKDVSLQQISEATEESFARLRVEALLEPKAGYEFASPQLIVNGVQLPFEITEEGALRFVFVFEDFSYRPVEYDGEDIGLVYNPDLYAAYFPEALQASDGDPQALIEYFCSEGMAAGHIANGFFDPKEIVRRLGEEEIYRDYLEIVYWDYLDYGYEEDWADLLVEWFIPAIENAL